MESVGRPPNDLYARPFELRLLLSYPAAMGEGPLRGMFSPGDCAE